MTTQRKVRKDFDKSKEYSVNVEGCTEEEKKEVQHAFFDAGILWSYGTLYQHLNAVQYSNKHAVGHMSAHLLYSHATNGCNMNREEFLDLVYEPEGHVHAELMLQYAEDAKTHPEPWELWQMKGVDGVWRGCEAHPMWVSSTEYRRKPNTHVVHGVEIPDLRITPGVDDEYYLADPTDVDLNIHYTSTGCDCDAVWVSRRLCYEPTEKGKQAAILHAKAMLGIA